MICQICINKINMIEDIPSGSYCLSYSCIINYISSSKVTTVHDSRINKIYSECEVRFYKYKCNDSYLYSTMIQCNESNFKQTILEFVKKIEYLSLLD